MHIPKQVKIGHKTYTIIKKTWIKNGVEGEVHYKAREIWIANTWRGVGNGKKCFFTFTPKQKYQTYWHEVIHVILGDMRRHDLNNEHFVIAFSKRLNQALFKQKN